MKFYLSNLALLFLIIIIIRTVLLRVIRRSTVYVSCIREIKLRSCHVALVAVEDRGEGVIINYSIIIILIIIVLLLILDVQHPAKQRSARIVLRAQDLGDFFS